MITVLWKKVTSGQFFIGGKIITESNQFGAGKTRGTRRRNAMGYLSSLISIFNSKFSFWIRKISLLRDTI